MSLRNLAQWSEVAIEVLAEMDEAALKVMGEAVIGMDPWVVQERRTT